MNILAFDTCFDACSVAVACAGVVTAERELMRRGHAEALLPMIERTMQRAGLAFAEVDRVAVTHGPGTFTGTRVGLSVALGLSFSYDLPVVTASSLQCIARAAIEALGARASAYQGIVITRDAKRDSVFYEISDMSGKELSPPALLTTAEARERTMQLMRGRCCLGLGTGIELLTGPEGEPLPGLENARNVAHSTLAAAFPEGIDEPDARYLLQDAAARTPVAAPVPLYLRPPDATPSSVPPLARLAATAAPRPDV